MSVAYGKSRRLRKAFGGRLFGQKRVDKREALQQGSVYVSWSLSSLCVLDIV